ncbi:MAG: DUF6493 family protein [Bacteroidota bacterium]
METKAKELSNLIKQQADLIPFLKELTKAEKKKLLPILAELKGVYHAREKVKRKDLNGKWYDTSGDYIYPERHRELILLAGVVCAHTLTAFRNNIQWNATQVLMLPEVVEKIYPWYVPKWGNNALNRVTEVRRDSYIEMMNIYKKGYFKPTDELFATLLVNSILRYKEEGEQRRLHYCIDELDIYPETLGRHLWLLFEIPTPIHSRYYSSYPGVSSDGLHPWMVTIEKLIDQNKISRDKVLRLCLLSCTKGFNKALTAWYFKLFDALQPNDEELLNLQKEIFTCLNSDSPKAITTALALIKKLFDKESLNKEQFLNAAPNLLSSSNKSNINATLSLLDKLATKNKEYIPRVLDAFMEALSNEDGKVQTKTARLIKKYNYDGSSVGENIIDFYPYLLSEAKAILSAFIPADYDPELEELEELEIEVLNVLAEENRVEKYEDLDQLVFFVSQVLDNNEPHHVEQLLVALPKLNKLITAENAKKLSPAFIRALRYMWVNYFERSPVIYSCALYLNDYAALLNEKFPGATPSRQAYFEKKTAEHVYYRDLYKTLEEKSNHSKVVDIIDHLCLLSKKYLISGLAIDLLSTVTHLPCWIDPDKLVDRIIEYEKLGLDIDLIDWQIALFRIPESAKLSTTTTGKIDQIKNQLLKDVLLYSFNQVELDLSKFGKPDFYLPIILRKNNEGELTKLKNYLNHDLENIIQQYAWQIGEVKYEGSQYNHRTKSFEKAILTKEVLSILAFNYKPEKKKGILGKLKNLVSTEPEKPSAPVSGLFKDIDLHGQRNPGWDLLFSFTIKHLFMLTPNHLTIFLSRVIQMKMGRSSITGEDDKRLLINILEFLNESWNRRNENEIIYVFLAACSLCSNKTVRQLVAELWVRAVPYGIFDSVLLGEITGKLLAKNYGPLKRLTDILAASMSNVSTTHNKELFAYLINVISNMDDAPVTNTKKLLEIYAELSLKEADGSVNPELKAKLEIWKETKSLKKVIAKIL